MNEAVFKTTVMGGFSKSDVLAFVDKQDSQFKEREKDLLGRINKLEADLRNETGRGAALDSKVKGLEAELEIEKNKCFGVEKQLQEANLEVGQAKTALNAEISNRDEEIDKLKQEVARLSRCLETAESKNCRCCCAC